MGVVIAVCAELVPRRLALPSEDTIHRGLAATLAAGAVALLLTREPTAPHPGVPTHPAEPTASAGPTRPELEASIAELARWLTRHTAEPRTPLTANLRLLALGRSALSPPAAGPGATLLLANLQALLSPAAEAAGAPTADGSADAPTRSDADPAATLAILLEAGTPQSDELALAAGPTPVRVLLEQALSRLEQTSQDAWALDLLSFAVLAGQNAWREPLARRTHSGLTRLDREQRQQPGLSDETAAGALRASLASDARRLDAPRERPLRLQLAASLFRAVAVLDEPDLEATARRQLSVLLQRELLEREVYRTLLAETPEATARVQLHLDALENLGRLEQALYGAHVAFRQTAEPTARTGASMQRIARELLEHLNGLRRTAALDTLAPQAASPELLRALTHALRGLRVSRIAT